MDEAANRRQEKGGYDMDIRRRFWQWEYEEPHVQRRPLGKMPDSERDARSIY
jgi:hypothetical protein